MKDSNKSKQQLILELAEARRQIEELKTTANALKDTEVRFRTLLDTSPDPIVIYDLQGNIIMANQQTAALYGVSTPEEFIAKVKNVWGFVDEPERVRVTERIKELLKSTTALKNKYKFLTNDKGYLIGEVNAAAIRDKDGTPTAILGILHDITQHEHIEKALLESEKIYRLLAENAHDVIFTMDLDLRFTYVSPSITRLRGFSVEEVLSQRLDEVVTPASLEGAMQVYMKEMEIESQEAKELQRNIVLELEMYCKDGSTLWTETTFSFLHDEQNNLTGILGITRDISERRRSEEALLQSERRFRALAEYSVDTIMRFDRQHRHLYVNPRVKDDTGIDPEQFIGKTHQEMGFPEDLCIFWENTIDKVFETGAVTRQEFMLPNGMWIDWRLAPETDENGEVIAVVTSSGDITERKRQEEALRESEENYRNIFENAVMGIFQTTPDGLYLRSNAAGSRMYGYESSEDMIQSVKDMSQQIYVDPKDRARFRAIMETDGHVENFESQHYRKDGSKIWTALSSRAVRDADGNTLYYETTIEDITARKLADEALRASEAFLDTIIENSPYAMSVYSEKGTLIRMNQACRDLLQATDANLIGKYNILKDDIIERQGSMSQAKGAFEKGEPVRFILDYNTARLQSVRLEKTVHVLLEATISPVLD